MPVQLRMPCSVPRKAVVESCNLAHAPAADWHEISIAAKGTAYQRIEAEAKVTPRVQVGYQRMSATGNEDSGLLEGDLAYHGGV